MSVDPCPTCGAAMAEDQRYCLACGNRRAEARLDYLEVLRGAPPAVAGAAATVAAEPSRHKANTTIIASVGCLLLAMGIGVLIGNSGNDNAAKQTAAPAQVIKVEGGGSGTAAAATAAAPVKKAAKAKKAKSSKASSDTGSAPTAAASKATNPTLKQLDSATGDDYAKQSQKLPNKLSTGGKPPPIDKSKPAGGGTQSETIG